MNHAMPPILAIDVDGVLLDPSRSGTGAWTDDVRARFDLEHGDLASFFNGPWQDVVNGRVPVEHALGDWLKMNGHAIDVAEFLDCWLEGDCCINDEVLDACRGWADRGVKLVLATNQEHRRAAFLRHRLGSVLPLSDVAYSALFGVTKPSPEFFTAADALIRTSAANVVFLDDLLPNVEAAAVHGWRAVHYTAAGKWRTEVERELDASWRDARSRRWPDR